MSSASMLAAACAGPPLNASSSNEQFPVMLTAVDRFATVWVEDRHYLVGEVAVRNLGTSDATLSALRITPSVRGNEPPLLDLHGRTLLACAAAANGRPAVSLVLPANEQLTLFLWHGIGSREVEPGFLHLMLEAPFQDPVPLNLVGLESPAPLAPPLQGGPWVAVFEPGFPFGHRRSSFARSSAPDTRFIPARFAIDWIRLDAKGRANSAIADDFARWYGFEESVLAVAEATVAAVRDGQNDVLTSLQPPPGWQPTDVAGNYICLDLGRGSFAFYEHLQKSSIEVRVGERVKVGQLLAKVGRSGVNSSGPHLHFHVADGPDLLFAQGRPYSIADFRSVGQYESMQAAEAGLPWVPHRSRGRRSGFPLPNAVVMFDE
jgi:murein DD-endopeptidase